MEAMTKHELLTKSRWITDSMIRSEILPSRYGRDLEIYQMVKDYKELNKCSDNKAAAFIAALKKVSRRTVWNIISEMEAEVAI